MRLFFIALLGATACGGGTDPHVIAGGGIGDGDIDGKVYVHVIDGADDTPLANATVAIAGKPELMTDAKGFVEIKDVDGPQTIAVKLQGYRNTVWAAVNGTNVTIPLQRSGNTIPQATLSGSITAWDPSGLGAGHVKGAAVLYSQSDNLGDAANNLNTPGMGNLCFGQQCNWTVVTRTGTVTVIAAIVDVDTKGNANPSDDTISIIGWATSTPITVMDRVNQSGIGLAIVQAGNLQNLTVDYGTPPASLTEKGALIGIEISDDEVAQLPLLDPTVNTLLAPKPAVFNATGGYRLTAIAQTPTGGLGAGSFLIKHDLAGPTLTAGEWLVPPVGVTATRDSAFWQPVTGAKIHNVQYTDAAGVEQLEISVFDNKVTSVAVPALVALPVSGQLTARVGGIGADIDPQDFSLDEDEDKVFGIASQPVTIN